jgi:5-hydroxyisourate hydrolase
MITTHVLDTSRGRPADGVPVRLDARDTAGVWREVARGVTDDDGRCRGLVPDASKLLRGVYRLTFDAGQYFDRARVPAFYPEVTVVFEIRDPAEHHHVPLLLSPYGYSTYRGS